ncbi:MAG: hypothetical protein LUD48_06215 [Prevotella sp.]|nr:hypothetical protein [Prevotella sp.]
MFMKKLFTLAFVALCTMSMSAQTTITWPTIEEAEAAGYEALWGSYEYGYVLPDNYVFADNDEITIEIPVASNVTPYTTGEGNSVIASSMGSSIGDNSNDAPFSFDGLYEGMKQPYAVFKVTPKVSGRLTMQYDRGGKNFTMYVFDATANDEDGQYILANTVSSNLGDDGTIIKTHTSVVDITKDHEYWVFAGGTGENLYFYGMSFCPMTSDEYYKAYGTFDTEIVWPTIDEAEAAGYEALWGSYEYGYVLPDNYVFADNDDITIEIPVASNVTPYTTGEGNSVIASSMGSSIGDDSNDAPFSFDGLYEGMKQPYAVFKVTPKVSGVLLTSYDRGGKNFTMYVFDATANDEDGQYIMANTVTSNLGDDGTIQKTHTSIVNLTKDHEYWVFAGGTGENLYFYEMKYTAMTSDNYYSCVNGESAGSEGGDNNQGESGSTMNLLTQLNDTIYAITASLEDATAFAAAVGDAAGFTDSGDGENWSFKMAAGVVLYSSDDLTIETATADSYIGTTGAGGKMPDIKADFPEYTAFMNLGSTLTQTLPDDIFIDDPADYASGGQGMYKVTPAVNGQLGFGVYAGDNSRSIGIYEMPTEEEIEADTNRGWVNIYTFCHAGTDDNSTRPDLPSKAPAYVYGDVTAGRQYLLIGGANKNLAMHQISFAPGENTGIKGITSIATSADNKIYSIDGRYLGTNKGSLSKGLYIMNGKKIVVK